MLRELGAFPGVLPLLDAHLPNRPTASDPAWLSMPIALPIAEELKEKPLEVVVEAIAAVANTLVRLARRDVSHRDLKPGNMYRYLDAWVVGDFGLVAVPDGDAITRNDKRLGPEHYTAYEMVIEPSTADPKPADVFSLGKTLWVLATRRTFPPGGHQASSERGLLIADLRPDHRADLLDGIVDRTTMLRAEARPTMAAVALDLDAWLKIRAAPSKNGAADLDVRDLVEPFRRKLRAEVAAEDTEQERVRMAQSAVRRVIELCGPLDAALRTLDARAEVGRVSHNHLSAVLHTPESHGSARRIFSADRVSSISSGSRHFPFAVSYGWGLDVDEKGLVTFRTVVYVGHVEVMGSDFWWEGRTPTAEIGSVELTRLLEQAVAGLRPQLKAALKTYEEKIG